MRHLLRCFVLALLMLAGAVGTVSACINDREVWIQERQFKSDYQPDAPTVSPSSELMSGGMVMTLGIGLFVGAGLIVRQTLKFR